MRADSSMSTTDFVAQLREIAIKAGARPLIIDQLDEIIEAPSEDEIDERINEAVDEAEKGAFENGRLEGENNKDNAVADAEKEMYDACVAAIEKLATEDPSEIGLTETQLYQLVNHVLWNVRP